MQPKFHYQLSNILDLQGRIEDARAAAREAVELQPDNEALNTHLDILMASRSWHPRLISACARRYLYRLRRAPRARSEAKDWAGR